MNTSPNPTPADDGLVARRATVRRTTILLLLEQWGPGYQRITGDGVRYVAEIAKATPDEWRWLAEHTAAHPEVWQETTPRGHDEWFQLRAEQGRQAYADALAAFQRGDYPTCRDRLDDALAYGNLVEAEWVRLHHHVTRTEAQASDGAAATPREA